ncbi:hypothetical protein MUK42_18924 [Musa troglodytarum]|uniref:Cytochrome b561 and DOMON domain-containing protein n=1 Tax=Musa troglodytarum TaxID=320322 RepID=A0A9E7K7L8_9LILI|nr:hypothetical protein MUK42_18924 [Musa troglodytarum]
MDAPGFQLALRFLVILAVASSAGAAGACSSVTFSNRVYAACSDLPRLSSSLHWSFDAAAATLSIAFVAPPPKPEGWVAWAINPTADGMIGSQALIAFHQPNGSMGVRTYNISGYGSIAEGAIDFQTSDLAAEYSGGVMRVFGKLKLPAGTTAVKQVWQVGSSVADGVPQQHATELENTQSKGTLDLIKGAVSVSEASSSRNKNVHGVLNAVSWGILLPIGAIFARYLKTFESADPTWFYLHVTCQIVGYGVGVGGWATGLSLGSKSKGIEYTTHRSIAMALFSLATLQVFALFLRPNKDHKYRLYWNIYHHLVGYTVITLGVVNVFKGLDILGVAHKWRAGYIIAVCILGGVALFLEVATWIVVLKRKSDVSTKPYGESSSNGMIVRAIKSLKEKRGSSARAIGKFIRDTYSDLPGTHAALLKLHLRRLRSQGGLRMVKKSYKISASGPESPAAGEKRKRSRPPKTAEAAALDGKRKRGRPPKVNAAATASGSGATVSTPKRRPGRPPKGGAAASPVVQKRKPGRPSKASLASAQSGETRKRGRPPKASVAAAQSGGTRKRGRPPKAATKDASSAVKRKPGRPPGSAASTPKPGETPQKRRGRPKKTQPLDQQQGVPSQNNVARGTETATPTEKRRGRPPKKKVS